MLKTTAEVTQISYYSLPHTIVTFCDVKFYGFRAEEMNEKWQEIKSERYHTYNSICEQNEKRSENLRAKVRNIHTQIRETRPFYRFWYNKKEKEMVDEADDLIRQANYLEKENQDLRSKRFFDGFEGHKKILEFLIQKGFSLTHTSTEGDEYMKKVDVWVLEEQE